MKMKHLFNILLIFLLSFKIGYANYVLIPMDTEQKNHLKAYGIAYWILQREVEVTWLLNYSGGSFLVKYAEAIEKECNIRGVSYKIIANADASKILLKIATPEVNMESIKLEKAPKIAVYSPKTKQPWDDAVTLTLTYAEIPYDIIYDEDVLKNLLPTYDWLHLHHEDFTGQYGKFYLAFKNSPWYIQQKREFEKLANQLGYNKVSEQKLDVAKKIKEYTAGGGFLFAMCSATDSYDIALSADGVDICAHMFDGDPAQANAQIKLNYDNCFAFTDFEISMNPNEYEFSNIDATKKRKVKSNEDYFYLFDFSAKWDPIPTMLCQNHTKVIKGFMGQTTSFNKEFLKASTLIMGQNTSANEAKYIHGEFGKGTWTFYGGHDPEDYQHMVGDPPTDLSLHPNSPGYRLILNNILFPAAKKQKQKT